MTACAYRSLEPVLVQRVTELRASRERDAVLVDVARRVAARRIARSLAGCTGVAMGGAAFIVSLAALLVTGDDHRYRAAATLLLLAAWPAAIAVGIVARVAARNVLAGDVRIPMSGDAAADLALLEARDPLRETVAAARAWERRSTALPLAALSLLTPLTIHWLVYAAVSLPGGAGEAALADFGTWIALSVIIVGHAHIALLVVAVRWAVKLRTVPTDVLQLAVHRAWGLALVVSSGIACIPGIVLVGIPPVLVAVTGLLFVPAMYVATVKKLAAERDRAGVDAGRLSGVRLPAGWRVRAWRSSAVVLGGSRSRPRRRARAGRRCSSRGGRTTGEGGRAVPAGATVITDAAAIREQARLVVLAVPSGVSRDVARSLGAHLDGRHFVVHGVRGLVGRGDGDDLRRRPRRDAGAPPGRPRGAGARVGPARRHGRA